MAAAPTAATASLPTIPIHAMSVRLYAVWTRDVAIIGTASSVRDFRIFPFNKSIFFFTNFTYRYCIFIISTTTILSFVFICNMESICLNIADSWIIFI